VLAAAMMMPAPTLHIVFEPGHVTPRHCITSLAARFVDTRAFIAQSKVDQNRAVTGDVVAVELLPEAAWLTQRVALMGAVKKAVSGEQP